MSIYLTLYRLITSSVDKERRKKKLFGRRIWQGGAPDSDEEYDEGAADIYYLSTSKCVGV